MPPEPIRSSASRARSRPRFQPYQGSGSASSSAIQLSVHRRTGRAAAASAGVASADSARRYQASILPVSLVALDVAAGRVVLRVEDGEAEQHDDGERRRSPRDPGAAPPDAGHQDHDEDGAEQQLERHHEDALAGEAVDLLVRVHAEQRRHHDHDAQRGQSRPSRIRSRMRSAGRSRLAQRVTPPRTASVSTVTIDQLPEPAAGVLGVAEPGGLAARGAGRRTAR